MESLQQWLPIIEFTGIFVFFGAMLLTRWKSGANGVATDIITTYKARVEQLESNEKMGIQRMHEHTQEIGKLQGILSEKDKEVERLRAILENRNPELVTTLKAIQGFMGKIEAHMAEHTRIIKNVPKKRGKKAV